MRIKLLSLLAAVPLLGQEKLDPRSTMHINLPEDSPITVVSADWGESSATPRGGAMLLDLHTSLTFRNTSDRRVRGITLLVQAQEVTPGGKASVSVPSLNVGPHDNFPIRVDLRLLRPLQGGSGPLVTIGLDGVLFEDLSFYGPDRLNSRRSMTVWELEARRDRKFYRDVLDRYGPESLKTHMLESLERQAQRGSMDARVAHSGRATAVGSERQIEFAFLDMPSSPLETISGLVRVSGSEMRAPRILIRNRSDKPVRAMEIGWIIRDTRGKQYVAGAIPMEVPLAPRQSTTIVQDASFGFSQPNGQPIAVDKVKAYVSSIEYGDGRIWIPARSAELPTPSPEEQRLAEMYRKRGLNTVMEELRKP